MTKAFEELRSEKRETRDPVQGQDQGLCEGNRKDFQTSISSHQKCGFMYGAQRTALLNLGKRESPSKPVNNLPEYSVRSRWTQVFEVLHYSAHQKQQDNGKVIS